MLKDNSQLKLSLSPYQGIYDAIRPDNYLLRRCRGFSKLRIMSDMTETSGF